MRTTRLIALNALPSARRTPLGARAETQASRWLLQALELVRRLAALHDPAAASTDVLSDVEEQREGQLLLGIMSTQQPGPCCSRRSRRFRERAEPPAGWDGHACSPLD